MVKDGHWRADDEDHEKTAWEESVRLREQMFWARIGGGVIPATQANSPTDDEARASMDGVVSAALTVPPVVAPNTAKPEKKTADSQAVVFDHNAPAREPRTPPEQTDAPAPSDHYSETPELRKEIDPASVQQPVIVEN
ncbi:hypothetical protein NQ176_g10174 [Zarea fungicola]|uniref:Uncharacterized protein n=1 Tax=Zarea fungicola TaxID=93591 RepID=A0ACC1MHQ6_9HYPO|nr:hypothetical protein NQ176_g10174 [Lecanicillium fungicola]